MFVFIILEQRQNDKQMISHILNSCNYLERFLKQYQLGNMEKTNDYKYQNQQENTEQIWQAINNVSRKIDTVTAILSNWVQKIQQSQMMTKHIPVVADKSRVRRSEKVLQRLKEQLANLRNENKCSWKQNNGIQEQQNKIRIRLKADIKDNREKKDGKRLRIRKQKNMHNVRQMLVTRYQQLSRRLGKLAISKLENRIRGISQENDGKYKQK